MFYYAINDLIEDAGSSHYISMAEHAVRSEGEEKMWQANYLHPKFHDCHSPSVGIFSKCI
jgi:hypothetical protein